MPTVAIIPARGGSKGIRNKNLRIIGDRPVIAYTVASALASTMIDRVVVSTDDPKIAATALEAGADVPFMRPTHLATDDAATAPVIQHAVSSLENQGMRCDPIVTLQPTSPFRDPSLIDDAIRLFFSARCDSVVTIAELDVPSSVVGVVMDGYFHSLLRPGGDMRRQVAPAAVRITGSVYVTARAVLYESKLLGERTLGLLTAGDQAIDLDTPADLARARRVMRKRIQPGEGDACV